MSNVIVKHLPYAADLDKPLKKTYVDTLLATEDNKAHSFDIALYLNNEAVTLPSGAAVTAYFIRGKDNATVSLTGKVSGNVASVTLNKSCYNKAGQFAIVIKVTSGDIIHTVFCGEGTIHASSSNTIVDAENVIPSLSDLLAQIAVMEEATKNANTATGKANTATTRANTAAAAIEGMTVSAKSTTAPSAEVTEKNGVKHVTFGLVTPDITFQVATGPAGTDVEMEQSGTAEAPVVKLTIPRGDTGAIDGIDYYEGTPKALGTASSGTANGLARGDHVHPMPTASDIGALPTSGTAANSSKLGGVAAADYQKKADALCMNLLWTNASQSSTFAAQTVSINLADYDIVEIQFRMSTSSPRLLATLRTRVGESATSEMKYVAAGPAYRRTVKATTTGVEFGDNDKFADVTTSANTVDNTYIIPVRIWGIKGVG